MVFFFFGSGSFKETMEMEKFNFTFSNHHMSIVIGSFKRDNKNRKL